MVRALQLRKQGAGESAIVGGPREDQHQIKEAKINKELVGGNMQLTNLSVPWLGSIGRSRTDGHVYVDFPIACATRRWIPFSKGRP
jgi:hypothetical protein